MTENYGKKVSVHIVRIDRPEFWPFVVWQKRYIAVPVVLSPYSSALMIPIW